MSRRPLPSDLFAAIVINAVVVIGVVIFHFLIGNEVPRSIAWIEAATPAVCGGLTILFLFKRSSGAADPAEIDTLRRESADNFAVIQRDLRNLGGILIQKLENRPADESDRDASLSATITDLAVSLAEAREALAAIATDLAETKSAAFEMQAQLDQQADALRAFEHSVERIRPESAPEEWDAGMGAAHGSLGRALTPSAAGPAISQLIDHARAAHPTEVSLASTDVESDYDEPEATIPTEDFSAGELVAEHAADIAPDESDEDDRLMMSIEDDYDDRPSAAQPDLLAIDGDSGPRKPRRPGRNDTALVAHIMIGIGNKPYLRGHGPGLSTAKGVPMEYVDVGRWQWIAPEGGSPLAVTLWKNDEIPADGDPVSVPAGMTLEISPHFGN